jgi:hypothetical protein
VSENRLLRRILGLQGKEVTGDLTKFHDEKLNNCSLQQERNLTGMEEMIMHTRCWP